MAQAQNMIEDNNWHGAQVYLDALTAHAKAKESEARAREAETKASHSDVKTKLDIIKAKDERQKTQADLRGAAVGRLIDHVATVSKKRVDDSVVVKNLADADLKRRMPMAAPAGR